MSSRVWHWAADVVSLWIVERRSPRDAIAAMPLLREATQEERAAVVRTTAQAIGRMRRLEFVLAGARGLVDWSAFDRALALVLGAAVDGEELSADNATRLLASTGHELDFQRLRDAEALVGAGASATERFARLHSVPDWFAELAPAQFGDAADAVCKALAGAAPRTLRTNLLRVPSRELLATELTKEGVTTRAARFAATALHVEGDTDLFATAAFRRGAFEQQDEASQLVVAVTAPPPGGKVLDLCAGNGGKSLALAAALRGRGLVMATDVHEGRLRVLAVRSRRAGTDNLQMCALLDGAWPSAVATFAANADRILVDAPCSGTGSWRRRPEARWTIDRAALAQMATTQESLLLRAAAALKPGARLVYATCSLLASENELRIAALCAAHPELELVRITEILGKEVARPIADATGTFLSLRPDVHGCDGFFAAVLRRRRDG